MDIGSYLKDYLAVSSPILRQIIEEKKVELRGTGKASLTYLNMISDYLEGGKRIRGALTLLGYQAVDGKELAKIIPVSCAMELLHAFLLIHDDIVDGDVVRRGKPTIHKLFAEKYGIDYGKSMAMILGDMVAFWGYQLIARSTFPTKSIVSSISTLNEVFTKTALGEFDDINSSYEEVTWENVLRTRVYKTALYSFVLPLKMGAILGNGDQTVLDAIEKYGEKVGLAFQLRDDYLGTFGNSALMGKSNDSDIRTGNKTLLFIKALELSGVDDCEFLRSKYGNLDIETHDIERIRRLFLKSGSADLVTKLASQYAREGVTWIPKITKSKEIQATLESLAEFVVSREK